METNMRTFCGGSVIIDLDLLTNSSWPEFSPCFHHSVLVWGPCGWLWITLPVFLLYLHKLTGSHHLSAQTVLKVIASVLLAVLSIADIAVTVSTSPWFVTPAFYQGHVIKILTFILSVVLMIRCRQKGLPSPCLLFFYWLFSLLAGVVPVYTYTVYWSATAVSRLCVCYVTFVILLCQFGLHLVAEGFPVEKRTSKREPCPEVTASFLSKITFHWISGLIWKGWRKPIRDEDLWDLPPFLKSHVVVPPFDRKWRQEMARITRKRHENSPTLSTSFQQGDLKTSTDDIPEKENLLELKELGNGESKETDKLPDVTVINKKSTPVKVSTSKSVLVCALLKAFVHELLISHAFRFCADVVQYLYPLLLKLLIGYIEERVGDTDWKGYGLVAAFFIVSICRSVLLSQCTFIALNLGIKIKTSLVTAVYKKALTMNNESRRQFTTGTILNLMSVDCNRVREVTNNLWVLWSAPFMMCLGFFFLYETLGVAIFAGMGIMVLLTPLNYRLSTYLRKLHNDKLIVKDQRLKNMNEVLNGIRVLKLYAWEGSFRDKVTEIRNKEIRLLWKLALLNSLNLFCFVGAPTLVTLATFMTYVMMSEDHYLDAQTAFVSLSLFNIIRQPMNQLPSCISLIVQAVVSIKRLSRYLCGQDLDPDSVTTDTEKGEAVSIRNGTFTWDRCLTSTLQNINVRVQKGQLVAVVGSVGAGKSSLLSAILGEMEKISGSVQLQGSVAYVPQQAWIQNLTLRKNVLFGHRYREKRYRDVIQSCALEPDFDILPGGDNTEIGEKGINLSGGQKQRVSLSRAVYSDRDVYLMDDPLSAVDSHVGKHIFHGVIGKQGILRKKTRILVTHGIHWLPMVDVIVVMDQGEITEVGSYEELLSHDGPFAQFLKTYLLQQEEQVEAVELDNVRAMLEKVESLTSSGLSPLGKSIKCGSPESEACQNPNPDTSCPRRSNTDEGSHVSDEGSHVSDGGSHVSDEDFSEDEEDIDEDPRSAEEHQLVGDEKSELGRVKFRVIQIYFHALGFLGAILILLVFFLYQSSGVFSNVWLSVWTEEPHLKNISHVINSTIDLTALSYYYLSIYGTASFLQAILIFFYAAVTYTQMVGAARILHRKLLDNVLRQPIMFFDTTPVGRIMNRFTRDIDIIDRQLPRILRQWLINVFKFLSIIVVISYSTPIFLAVAIPILILYIFIQFKGDSEIKNRLKWTYSLVIASLNIQLNLIQGWRIYIPTSRQLRRNDSTSRSPILTHFSETISGAISIRAYAAGKKFSREFLQRVDRNNIFHYAAVSANRWLKMRLEFLGNLVVLSAAFFAVVTPGVSGGLVGLSVVYALQVTGALNVLVQITTQLETNIVSVERIVEYSELPTEGDWIISAKRPPSDWPEKGEVKLDNVQVRYRPQLDLVLKGISSRFAPGEKIGVVGRTGAGKSSLTLALFRILQAESGKIMIDGQNIADIGLHDLRSRLTILPQDPVLFCGTLRMNLDPFDQHTDDELWVALEQAHLKDHVISLPAGLQHECEEDGQNLSVGQRQLVCLARSLLRKTRILVLDEATAAVDMETDELIQKTIRTAFHDCTVITIAHRLNTILDYDRIMVLSAGQIVEFDSPDNLLQNKAGEFYKLARDANIVS